MCVRLLSSHPDYEKFAIMQQLLCMITNPHMVMGYDMDMPEMEMAAMKERMKQHIGAMIDEYEYLPPELAKIINKLEGE